MRTKQINHPTKWKILFDWRAGRVRRVFYLNRFSEVLFTLHHLTRSGEWKQVLCRVISREELALRVLRHCLPASAIWRLF